MILPHVYTSVLWQRGGLHLIGSIFCAHLSCESSKEFCLIQISPPVCIRCIKNGSKMLNRRRVYGIPANLRR
jgi:hypothetical protein